MKFLFRQRNEKFLTFSYPWRSKADPSNEDLTGDEKRSAQVKSGNERKPAIRLCNVILHRNNVDLKFRFLSKLVFVGKSTFLLLIMLTQYISSLFTKRIYWHDWKLSVKIDTKNQEYGRQLNSHLKEWMTNSQMRAWIRLPRQSYPNVIRAWVVLWSNQSSKCT